MKIDSQCDEEFWSFYKKELKILNIVFRGLSVIGSLNGDVKRLFYMCEHNIYRIKNLIPVKMIEAQIMNNIKIPKNEYLIFHL